MSRYGNVKAGAYNKLNVDSENEDTSEKLNDVERILTKMGISIRKTNLEFKDFDEVMDNIAEKWDTMDNVSKKAIANAFAGIRQQESFLILAENYDKYKGLLEVSENSQGTAERKYQSYKESYAAAKNELTATLERIANSSEISKLLTTLTKQLTGILDFFQGAYKFFPAILSALSYLRTIQGKNIFQTAARMWEQRKQGNNGFGGQNIDGSIRNPFARMRNKFADVRAGMRAREYDKMGDDEKSQQRKKKLQEQDAKYQKQLQDRDMKYRQKILKNTEKELINKKSILNMAEQEALKKEIVTDEAENQKTLESVKSTLAQEGLLAEGEKLTYEKAIAIQESGVLKDREAGKQLEDIIVKNRMDGSTQQAYANNAANAKSKFRAAGGLNGNSGFMKGITVASAIANTLTTAFSQFSTAANTHEYGGETVESSKEAQKAGSRASAVISMLPFLGSVIGPIVGESVAARIDMQRDMINYSSKKSTENLNILKGIDNSLEQIQSTEANSLERSKAVKEFKTQIFDEENKNLRKMLQKHLGNDNLSSILNSINSNTSESVEAMKKLQIAQIRAEKEQIANKYASTDYEQTQELGDLLSQYEKYEGAGHADTVGSHIGIGIGTGAGAGALAGSMVLPGVGTAIGALIGGVLGGITGIFTGISAAKAEDEQDKHDYRGKSSWQSMSLYEKIDYINEEMQKKQDEGESTTIYSDMLNVLQRQMSLQSQIIDEMNDLTLQQALVETKINGSYLTEMSTEQLKGLVVNSKTGMAGGIEGILTAYANQIGTDLLDVDVWDESGKKLSVSGYEYLYKKLKELGDEEINAVLSGEAFTLEEALKLRNKYGADSIQVQKILRSFADSLNLTTDQLDGVLDKYGKLTLAETYLSTQDLATKTEEMANLMSSVANGAGEISGWMETIINQFPDLVYYMGNMPEMFDQAIIKIKQFSHEYINAQYQSIMDNSELFNTIEDELYKNITDSVGEATVDALRGKNVQKLSQVMQWAQGQVTDGGVLSKTAKTVLEEVKAIADEAGMKVVSNTLKQYYDMLINFRTQQIDKQIEGLESQKEVLKEITNQREYENKLVEARLKLEDANKQKKRVYRAGIGWTYQSDQQAIETAQKELENLQNEKKISELDARIATLQGQKTELSEMYEKENYENLRKIYEASERQGDIAQGTNSAISTLKTSVDGISTSLSELIDAQMKTLASDKKEAVTKAQEAWATLQKATPGTSAYNTALENFHSAMSDAEENGLLRENLFSTNEKGEKVLSWGTYGRTDGRIGKDSNPWDVYQGDITSQKMTESKYISIQSPRGWYTGYTGDFASSSDKSEMLKMAKIFGRLQNNIRVWDNKGNRYSINGNDPAYTLDIEENSLDDYFNNLSKATNKNEFVIGGIGDEVGGQALYYKNGMIYKLVNNNVPHLKWTKNSSFKFPDQNALGTLGLQNDSVSLINELGTEAIITPQGTLTALPSRTGIVPADVTKNLWELGEVAPSLINILDGKLSPDKIGKSVFDGIINDDSFNIDNLVMNVSADSSFDVDKFVSLIRSRVVLTKNSK